MFQDEIENGGSSNGGTAKPTETPSRSVGKGIPRDPADELEVGGSSMKERLRNFEQFAVDVIYGKRKGAAARALGGFLYSLSLLFKRIVKTRLWLYRNRILRDAHLGCLVIVVGNLTVGGTGKTPVVERLAKTLHDRGRKVAILSRGYKSKKEPLYRKAWRALIHKEPEPPKIVSDGNQVLLTSLDAGDEPYMLARNLPGVVVLVDKDRVKAGVYAVKRFGADTLILDDGFQYFKLKDHLQLLMVDKTNPFGNGHMLPRGILREPVEHLKRASYVFLTKSDGNPDPELEQQIQQLKPGAEIIECTHRPQYLREVFGEHQEPLSFLKGKKVACLSAIAVPESFENFVADLGAEITHRSRFLDHHRFSREELEAVYEKARQSGAELIATTEKDAVRIETDVRPAIPFYFLRVEIEILSGVKDFEEAVSRICFSKGKNRVIRRGHATGARREEGKESA